MKYNAIRGSRVIMEQQAPSINLLDVLRGIGRHKLLILTLTVFGFAAGFGFISISKTLYSTEAQVLIENLAKGRTRATYD